MHIKLKLNDHEYIQSNKYYVVYAISFMDEIEYAIQLERFPSAPSFYSASLFVISDWRLSKHWTIPSQINEQRSLITFNDWANDSAFYENLVNGTGNAGPSWRNIKPLLDREFAPPGLLVKATPLTDGWVTCTACDEAWCPDQAGEVVVCPECYKLQLRVLD